MTVELSRSAAPPRRGDLAPGTRERELRTALQKDPDNPQFLRDLSLNLVEQGRYEAARSPFQKLLGLENRWPHVDAYILEAMYILGKRGEIRSYIARMSQERDPILIRGLIDVVMLYSADPNDPAIPMLLSRQQNILYELLFHNPLDITALVELRHHFRQLLLIAGGDGDPKLLEEFASRIGRTSRGIAYVENGDPSLNIKARLQAELRRRVYGERAA